jgi:hypothetical protein
MHAPSSSSQSPCYPACLLSASTPTSPPGLHPQKVLRTSCPVLTAWPAQDEGSERSLANPALLPTMYTHDSAKLSWWMARVYYKPEEEREDLELKGS